jgi:hypothetical protein
MQKLDFCQACLIVCGPHDFLRDYLTFDDLGDLRISNYSDLRHLRNPQTSFGILKLWWIQKH